MEYSEETLRLLLGDMPVADGDAMEKARARQGSLAKPPHSLGKLEDISIRLAGVTGNINNSLRDRRVLIFAADNGVVEEGVATTPQSVTLAQTINFTRGLTGVAVLAKHFHTSITVVDMGINASFHCDGVLDRSIAKGTKNFAKEPAMTREEAVRAILTGMEVAMRAADEGADVLGAGEMGIGNTTTSSAVLSALTGLPVEVTVGRGGGLNDQGFEKKKRVIREALLRYALTPRDPVRVLSCVGGFDIAAMAGAFLGAAKKRVPVVIDGYISAVAALTAYRLCAGCAYAMFPSHASVEPGYRHAMECLRLDPILNMNMRLGEGSGCPIAFEVMDAACTVINDMATFAEARIEDDYLAELRADDKCF